MVTTGLTTLPVPTDISLFFSRTSSGSLTTVTPISGKTTTTLSGGFDLYVGVTVPSTSPSALIVSPFINAKASGNATSSLSLWTFVAPASPIVDTATPQNFTLTAGYTLCVPVSSFGTSVDDAAITAWRDSVLASALPSSTTPTNQSTSTPSAFHATSSSDQFSEAALIGGIVGAFFLGLLVCLLAFVLYLCYGKKRRAHKSVDPRASPKSSSEKSEAATQIPAGLAGAVGWQKHIPQDKDDRTIIQMFQMFFDQIEIHVEGFYVSRSGELSSKGIALLQTLPPDNLAKMLPRTNETHPLLQGILVRWIVHKISLRSKSEESLLSREYTLIPEKNNWHMESDGDDSPLIVESTKDEQSKRGIGLQGPDPKIDQAVRGLTEAFSPWELPDKSDANRTESLRQILQHATQAGILLYSQRATFVFDWSNTKPGSKWTVTVTPALVKRADEFANPLSSPQVLIEARRANISRSRGSGR